MQEESAPFCVKMKNLASPNGILYNKALADSDRSGSGWKRVF